VLNVFHYDRAYPSRYRDPYRAWTVIPRTSFGRANVRGVHADRARLVHEQPAFVLQHRSPVAAPPRSPYPSPFNARLNPGATAVDRTPVTGGVSTMSPRSYGRYGSDRDSRGGHAAPIGSTSEDTTYVSPYERARVYMPRPDARGDEGSVYRRVPSDQSPVRSPGGLWRDHGDRGDDGRAGPGYASPGYRVRDSPGMSRPPERDHSPGMSDSNAGSRHAAPRGDDGGDRGGRGGGAGVERSSGGSSDRGGSSRSSGDGNHGDGNRGGGDRGGDGGGSRGGSSSGSSGGAVRRHP
jgi:hypothetical protein